MQKVLARAGVASRRRAEEMISQGRVRINGVSVTELGIKVDPSRDKIEVDGRAVAFAPEAEYVMVNKPAGYVSTTSDTHGRRTVMELVPEVGRLFPAGRLDADSEGLLLLTNDGEVTLRLTHPRYEQQKEYWALVRKAPSREALDRLESGVALEGGVASAIRANILGERASGVESTSAGGAWVRVAVTEGRKRLVRRMLAAIGHPVQRLIRVRLGPLRLGDLPPGKWRRLLPGEVAALKRLVRAEPDARGERAHPRPRGARPLKPTRPSDRGASKDAPAAARSREKSRMSGRSGTS